MPAVLVVPRGGRVGITVAPLRRPRLGEAAAVLVDCFFEDANIRAVYHPDPQWRAKALSHVFRAGLKDALGQGGPMIALDEADVVVGAAMWLPPGAFRLTRWRRAMLIRHALGIVLADPSSVPRQSRLTKAKDALHPAKPHWYLVALGVAEAARGQGIGSRLLAAGTARADAEHTACYLETADEDNVVFYQNAGFEVLDDDAYFLDHGPRVWTMWREPLPL
ncbi:MAG TPA: GNAT family N-acetyltransferase [Cryptosporangiaceae bacterium]|nr:GNAT family N-acetyltransferase [Cryptosporangiaceae bacterium]